MSGAWAELSWEDAEGASTSGRLWRLVTFHDGAPLAAGDANRGLPGADCLVDRVCGLALRDLHVLGHNHAPLVTGQSRFGLYPSAAHFNRSTRIRDAHAASAGCSSKPSGWAKAVACVDEPERTAITSPRWFVTGMAATAARSR